MMMMCGALVLGGTTAALAKGVAYSARYKAKYPAVADGGSIAVVNFNGKDGDNFADALASELQSAELDGAPIFQVKTIDSMNYRSTGDISKAEVATAIRTGQKLGVRTVFTGTVSSASVNSTNYTKEESVCTESAGLFKCKKTETRQIPCNKVVGQYTVTPRAIRVENGSVIFAETISTQGEYSVCNGQLQGNASLSDLFGGLFGKKSATPAPPPVASPDALLAKLRQDATGAIRRMVAPYNKTVNVTLKEKATGLTKPENQQFANAIAFANVGRMDRACGIFETLSTDANKANVALLYNLGVCQEVLLPDEPAAALEYYSKADQLLDKPDKLVSDAYVRMKAMVGQSRSIR
jgi:hypothetical protein